MNEKKNKPPADTSPRLELFAPLLRDLLAWLKAEKVRGSMIGGLAVSLRSRPRLTQDIDFLILLEPSRWEHFLSAGERYGFEPRLKDALVFAKKSQVFLMQHRKTGIHADLIIAALPMEEEMILRATEVVLGDVRLPTLCTEDLVLLKLVARRAKDLEDIRQLIKSLSQAALKELQHQAHHLAELLEDAAIEKDFSRLLAEDAKQSGRD